MLNGTPSDYESESDFDSNSDYSDSDKSITALLPRRSPPPPASPSPTAPLPCHAQPLTVVPSPAWPRPYCVEGIWWDQRAALQEL
jgi:hypothetical protein